jgi:hypothetical protein
MRLSENLAAVAATAFAAVFMVAVVFLAPGLALAEPASRIPARAHPDLDLRNALDAFDELATLDAVHTALAQVGDGGTYVWHRHNGRISAVLELKRSFIGNGGKVCRALSVMFASGQHMRRTEATACRLADGGWQLDG